MAKSRGLSCGVFIVDKNKNILMQHVKGPDFWDIPKGGQKNWESLEETAVREVLEETGLIIKKDDLIHLGIYTYNNFKDLYAFVLRVDEIDTRKLAATGLKKESSHGFVDEYKMVSLDICAQKMCNSLEYLYLERLRKEIRVILKRGEQHNDETAQVGYSLEQ